jgi:Mg2+ and Co2+ transporter CorA
MNVSLPGEDHPLAFLVVFGVSLTLTGIAVFIFAKRDWF